MKIRTIASLLAACAALSGCAHMINITPPLNTISGEGITRSNKVVGYYISAEQRARLVTTPGGGGDKVSYKPYAEAEPALNQMLQNLYAQVIPLGSMTDAAIADKHIAFVFTPDIQTTSSSSSALTWPPTNFTITIVCKATDPAGASAWQGSVTGTGVAEYSEFKHDFSLAARRAAKDGFNKLQAKLAEAGELH